MGKMTIIKAPTCENDSAMISMSIESIKRLENILRDDPYYRLKNLKFFSKDITSDGFHDFSMDRPSLRGLSKYVEGTVYTYACQGKNGMPYEKLLDTVREMLNMKSRRAFVTMSDRLADYRSSIDGLVDVSCLTGIHYQEDRVSLFFRACDLKNEFLVDMLTIFDYFIFPVYSVRMHGKMRVEIFISSCQNYGNINNLKSIVNENFES